MDIIEVMFEEFQNLKREQKHRRLDWHADDHSFYTQTTEIAIEKRLEELKLLIEQEFLNQNKK